MPTVSEHTERMLIISEWTFKYFLSILVVLLIIIEIFNNKYHIRDTCFISRQANLWSERMRKLSSSERWKEVGRCLNICDRKYHSSVTRSNENTHGIMSETKKVAFSTLGPIKREKKRAKEVKSLRIILTLPESNEKSCPEFNYRELVTQKLVSLQTCVWYKHLVECIIYV